MKKGWSMMNRQVYGYVNGKAVYSGEDFVFEKRGFGPISDDTALIAYAEKVTHGWHSASWKRTFTTFFLDTYEVSREFTKAEFARLQELQRQARAEKRAADEARCWKKVGTYAYADNSVEEVWEDKDGNRKTVMAVYPHGDAC